MEKFLRNYPTEQLKKIITESNHSMFSEAIKELEQRNELSVLEVSESAEAIEAQIKILVRTGLNSNLSKIESLTKKLAEPSAELKQIINKVIFLVSKCEVEKTKIIEASIDARESENTLYFGASKLFGIGTKRDIELALKCLEYSLGDEEDTFAETLYFFGMSSIENHWDFDRSISMFKHSLQNRNLLAIKFIVLYLETKIKRPEQLKRNFEFSWEFNLDSSYSGHDKNEEEIKFLALNMEKNGAISGPDVLLAMFLPNEYFVLKDQTLERFYRDSKTYLNRIIPIFNDGRKISQQIEQWILTNFSLFYNSKKDFYEPELEIFLNLDLRDISFDGEIQVLFNHYFNFEELIPDQFLNFEISRFKLCLSISEFCEFIEVSRQAYDSWKKGVPMRSRNKMKVIEKIKKGEELVQNGLWPNREFVLNQKSNRAKLLNKIIRN